MKAKLLGLALVLLGAAILIASLSRDSHSRAPSGPRFSGATLALATVCGGAIGVFGILILLTAFGARGKSAALARLDHFLPFLRKKKKNETLRPPAILVRGARRVLPAALFSDPITGKPGLARRWCKRIGPSMLSSPARRLVQTACLLLFLALFFYVCWPYTARPRAPGQISAGWRLDAIDEQTGSLRLVREGAATWMPQPNEIVCLIDERTAGDVPWYLSELSVVDSSAAAIALKPKADLPDDALTRILTSTGGWTVGERSPWPAHYAEELARKEVVPAEGFLAIDPLVSLSTALAARSWVWSLASAAIILIVCVLVPRGFCGYICPLGTLIDLFDWAIGKRVKKLRVADDGWWVHVKYYLLAGTLVAAWCGVLVSGFVAAIPVITRGMLFIGAPLQIGFLRGWHQAPSLNAGNFVSIGLFGLVLGLGFLKPRFWCKYVCPSGAVFSLGNMLRVSERKVESSCINCNKCVEICPFDAIKPDFTTRVSDCTMCQTCGGVCPVHAIKFVDRWNGVELKLLNDPPTGETVLGRRGFVSLVAGVGSALIGGAGLAVATKAFGANLDKPGAYLPVRPPGSVPERDFLDLCIRCGECFKACPNNVLQPMGFEQGLEGIWTPRVVADWAGCESSCNACGTVCPTGAIRALPLEEKKVARMGLAIVNQETCLPFADREACDLCYKECTQAGYHAIEFQHVHTQFDATGEPIEGTGFDAPVVLAEKCVGCGLCQTRCYAINVKAKRLFEHSAIIVEAGEGKEDRLLHGAYTDLRRDEAQRRAAAAEPAGPAQPAPLPPAAKADPFGVGKPDSPF